MNVVYVHGIYCRNLPIGIDSNAACSKSDDDDTCPLVLCYSTSCGTDMNALLMSVNHSGYIGKTTAALSIFGTEY